MILEKDYFNGKYLDSTIAPAVLIYESAGEGVIHSRAAEGKIDVLSTGPKAGNKFRILVMTNGRTCLVFRSVSLRLFLYRE